MTQEIDAFMKYLQEVKKISKNTAVSYETDLRKMKEFLYSEGVLSVEDVRQEHLKIYMEKQEQEGKKPATISRGLASMKAFFQYLVVQNYVNQNVTDGLKAPKLEKKAPVILSMEETSRLLDQPNGNTPKELRDHAMLELLYATGIRVSELISLKLPAEMLIKKELFLLEKQQKRLCSIIWKREDHILSVKRAVNIFSPTVPAKK